MNNSTTIVPTDVLIVTAIQDELNAVQRLRELGDKVEWQERQDSAGFLFYQRPFHRYDGLEFTVALACAVTMGGKGATNVATRLVKELNPFCIAMCGICAGDRRRVFLGDVIVAERTFNAEEGKLIAARDVQGNRTELVLHELTTYSLDLRWKQRAETFDREWNPEFVKSRPKSFDYQARWLRDALLSHETGRGPAVTARDDFRLECPDYSSVIKKLWEFGHIKKSKLELTSVGRRAAQAIRTQYLDSIPPDPSFRVHVGPLATVGKVIEDPDIFDRIRPLERHTLGLEMEGSAIGLVAAAEGIDWMLVAKGVQDFAVDKKDSYREFAATASAEFVLEFLKRYLPSRDGSMPSLEVGRQKHMNPTSEPVTATRRLADRASRPTLDVAFPHVVDLMNRLGDPGHGR